MFISLVVLMQRTVSYIIIIITRMLFFVFNTKLFVFLTNCNLNKKLLQQCAFLIHLNKLMQNKYKFTLHQNDLIPKSVNRLVAHQLNKILNACYTYVVPIVR